MANATQSELQAEVNTAQSAVEGCGTALAAAEGGAQEQETTLSIGESRHNECELEMAQLTKKAEDDCKGVQLFIDSLSAPVDLASINLSDTSAVEDGLQKNYAFFEENYPKFIDEDTHCSARPTRRTSRAPSAR